MECMQVQHSTSRVHIFHCSARTAGYSSDAAVSQSFCWRARLQELLQAGSGACQELQTSHIRFPDQGGAACWHRWQSLVCSSRQRNSILVAPGRSCISKFNQLRFSEGLCRAAVYTPLLHLQLRSCIQSFAAGCSTIDFHVDIMICRCAAWLLF